MKEQGKLQQLSAARTAHAGRLFQPDWHLRIALFQSDSATRQAPPNTASTRLALRAEPTRRYRRVLGSSSDSPLWSSRQRVMPTVRRNLSIDKFAS